MLKQQKERPCGPSRLQYIRRRPQQVRGTPWRGVARCCAGSRDLRLRAPHRRLRFKHCDGNHLRACDEAGFALAQRQFRAAAPACAQAGTSPTHLVRLPLAAGRSKPQPSSDDTIIPPYSWPGAEIPCLTAPHSRLCAHTFELTPASSASSASRHSTGGSAAGTSLRQCHASLRLGGTSCMRRRSAAWRRHRQQSLQLLQHIRRRRWRGNCRSCSVSAAPGRRAPMRRRSRCRPTTTASLAYRLLLLLQRRWRTRGTHDRLHIRDDRARATAVAATSAARNTAYGHGRD